MASSVIMDSLVHWYSCNSWDVESLQPIWW